MTTLCFEGRPPSSTPDDTFTVIAEAAPSQRCIAAA